MTQKNPLISILVNCYNSEKFLKDCLNSLINQTYENIEIIVWDNASSDKTAQIVSEFNDPRICYYLSNIHRNLVESRITAWSKINGEYVAIMDSDDLSYIDRLKIQLDIINKSKNIAVVGGGVEYINDLGDTISYKKFSVSNKKLKNEIFYKFPMNNSALFFDKKKIDNVGGYSNQYVFINDYELLFRLSKKYDIVNTDVIVSKNRIHKENLSNKNFLSMQNELLFFLNKIKSEIKSPIIKILNFIERYKCHFRLFRINYF